MYQKILNLAGSEIKEIVGFRPSFEKGTVTYCYQAMFGGLLMYSSVITKFWGSSEKLHPLMIQKWKQMFLTILFMPLLDPKVLFY